MFTTVCLTRFTLEPLISDLQVANVVSRWWRQSMLECGHRAAGSCLKQDHPARGVPKRHMNSVIDASPAAASTVTINVAALGYIVPIRTGSVGTRGLEPSTCVSGTDTSSCVGREEARPSANKVWSTAVNPLALFTGRACIYRHLVKTLDGAPSMEPNMVGGWIKP